MRETTRSTTKDEAARGLLQLKQVRHLEKVERNTLRTLDVAENIEYLRRLKQETQDYYCKQEYLKNAYNAQVRRYSTIPHFGRQPHDNVICFQ